MGVVSCRPVTKDYVPPTVCRLVLSPWPVASSSTINATCDKMASSVAWLSAISTRVRDDLFKRGQPAFKIPTVSVPASKVGGAEVILVLE